MNTNAFSLILILIGIDCAIDSFERLNSFKALWSYGALASNAELPSKSSIASRLYSFIYMPSVFYYALVLRGLLAALLIIFSCELATALNIVVPLFLIQLYLNLLDSRRLYLAGDRILATMILGSLALLRLTPESTSIQAATLIFIAIQGLGAYFFAGVHKLLEPRWRSGVLLKNIYYQSSFAVPWLTRQSWMSHINWKIASLTIIIIELSAGFILTLPRPFVWSFLSIALLFHIWNVLTWGLNHFLLTFSASFPAILWCYEWLHIN